MSINRVQLVGNLTRDPELRTTSKGTPILHFGLAVNDRVKGADGKWEDRPNFVDCTVFGNRAEPLSRFVAKGQKVAVEGKLRYLAWEKDGVKRSKLEVICDEVELMQRRDPGQQAQADRQPYAASAPQRFVQAASEQPMTQQQLADYAGQMGATVTQEQPEDVYDEDIPF